jgi:hypothetical protein
MANEDEMMHEVGGFEPTDAKRVLEALEAAGVPFEIDADHSDLLASGRDLQLYLGMYPPGSRLLVFVPESSLAKAQEIVAKLFPV